MVEAWKLVVVALVVVLSGCDTDADQGRDGGPDAGTAEAEGVEERIAELEAEVERLTNRAEAAETRAERAEAEAESLGDQLIAMEEELEIGVGGVSGEATEVAEGEPGTDMGWRYLITGLECVNGYTIEYDWDDSPEEYWAQGQFCTVDIQLERVGDEPGYFYGNDSRLVDSDGRSHRFDDVTFEWNSVKGTQYGDDMNPGQSGEALLVFDIPREVIPDALILVEDEWESPGLMMELPEPEWAGEGDVEWQENA